MPFEAPALAPVDESRRGILSMAPEVLLGLLRIPGAHRVEEIRVSATGALQIEIVGEDMLEGMLPKPVVLLCTAVTNRATGDRSVFGSWEHKPERRWRIR